MEGGSRVLEEQAKEIQRDDTRDEASALAFLKHTDEWIKLTR